MGQTFSEADGDRKVLTVGDGVDARLDAWLAAQLSGVLSRSRLKALIVSGQVRVNDIPVAEPKRRITTDDRIVVVLPPPEDPTPRGEDIPIDILHEDADLIVVDKPAGLVVHPAAGHWTGTLVNALIHHCADSLSGIGGVRRPGIVHRLDRDTSGIMVVAKTDTAHRDLAEQFADHGRTGGLERAYRALVWGRPAGLKGTIDTHLGRAGDRLRRAVRPAGSSDAKHAITHYSVTRRFGERADGSALASDVVCRLETGRTHQIRVHMAHIGNPLIGDRDYGSGFATKVNTLDDPSRRAVGALRGQALHAFLLQFEHPRTGALMRFEKDPPADFERLIAALSDIRSDE